jgi:hypothetical protein
LLLIERFRLVSEAGASVYSASKNRSWGIP